ncbi:TPA: PSII 6.1 kDa protein, variant 3 [Trebouxia sp. C0005]
MADSLLEMELDGVSHKILQGHIRESMRKVLIALSPKLGISQEHLLSEFDQLLAPGSQTHIQSCGFEFATGLASVDAPQGQLSFQHECVHLTCPLNNTRCALCQQNPNRRCEVGNNFAPKQLEKQHLTASCGSPINLNLKNLVPAWKDSTAEAQSSPTTSPPGTERLCLEFSLLNGSTHDQWLQQKHDGAKMDEDSRLACEVLRSRKAGRKALLQGGWMSYRTPENRIRVEITNKPLMLVDLTIQENSEARLGKDVQYKLLVLAINESTNKELAQLVSQSFSVTTMRSKGSLKPSLPCLDDPVTKLEGLGEKTRRNLLDVRACAATLDLAASIPQDCPNSVTTVRNFQELVECLEVNNHCPKSLSRALLPEAAMEHALKAVQTDNRVRRWKADADSQWELLYKCSKSQIDWNSPDVLVRHGTGVEQHWVSMAGRTTPEQATKMCQLAGQALEAWKVEGHPGWSVDTMDSHHLCHLDQQQGSVPQPSLATYRPKHLQALGAVLGNPLPSPQPGLSDSNSLGSSHEDPLHHPGGPPDASPRAGAGQDAAAMGNGPLGFGLGQHSLPDAPAVLDTLPALSLLKFEGDPPQQQEGAAPSTLLPSVFQLSSTHDGSSSSGSHPLRIQNEAGAASQPQPCSSSNGTKARPRSRRLATKRAQHEAQDSPESPVRAQSTERASQQNPEADHQFKQILGKGANALGQLPSAGHLNIGQIQKELSLKRGLLMTGQSSNTAAKPSVPHGGAGVMTLDEALDSMSPTGFAMGLQNPFENAAGDGSWEFPASAEGNERWQGGHRDSSNASATCHEASSRSQCAFCPCVGLHHQDVYNIMCNYLAGCGMTSCLSACSLACDNERVNAK